MVLCWLVSVYTKCNDKVLEKETEFWGGADKGGEGRNESILVKMLN